MAEQADPGAPVAKDAIDPDLVKLARTRAKIGVITAAGLVFLCGFFLLRLAPDRRFSGEAAQPTKTTVTEVLAGNVGLDRFVTVEAEPLMSHAIRTTTAKGSLGLRVVPTRGTGERMWIVVSGDGWDAPARNGYAGRLRKLSDLPFAGALGAFSNQHPQPVFASASAVRAGLATGKVTTVSGDTVTLADSDHVALDVIDPNAAVVIGTLNGRLPTEAAWTTALAGAGITTTGTPQANGDQVRFDVTMPGAVQTLTSKLETAGLWAARVEPVTHHDETTWGALRSSSPSGFTLTGATIPDQEIDLVGLYVARPIPSDAYAVLTDERPEDYWYVLPVSVSLGVIGLIFGWALIRAVKRDLLPTRAA